MKFRYSARTKTGELQVGFVEAPQKDAALSILSGHELYVLSLEEIKAARFLPGLTAFRRVRRKDLMIFTRQFATMLEAKIPINDALKALYNQTRSQNLREVVYEVSADIESGLSLSQAFERHSDTFSEFFVNLIRAAEITGRMEEAIGFLADHLEKEAVLIAKIRNAMYYPAFIILMFFVAAGVMLGLVFPQIAPIFAESKAELPAITKVFLSAGTFVQNWWLAILIALAGGVAVLTQDFRSAEGKAVFDEFALHTPLVGDLFKKVYVARVAETVSVLIKGGIPIAQAIEISGHTVGNALYQEILHIAAEGIRRGELLSQIMLAHEKYFPPLVYQMVALGEQTGKLEEMFGRISVFYVREVDNVVASLIELIQPILMVVIGVLVGFLFASILIPIYNLVSSFQ